MMRNPSPHVSKRHKARLEKHLKQTIAPEKRLSFKESLLQQLVKMQKDANAGKLTFDASTMEALGECCFILLYNSVKFSTASLVGKLYFHVLWTIKKIN